MLKKLFKKPTAWAVVLFVIAITWGLLAEAATPPKHQMTLGLAYGIVNTQDMVTQRIGYVRNDKWYVRAERFGGDGYQESWAGSFGRQVVFRKGKTFEPIMTLGVSFFDRPLTQSNGYQPVADDITFQLGITVRFKGLVGLNIDDHNSTAGRSDPNKGIDRAGLDFYWKFDE